VAERDIDLVLITGAGASCAFGAGDTRLPMMGEWADALTKKLARSASGYLKATGLEPDLPGMEFERRLGSFLRQVTAFSEIEPLVGVTRDMIVEPDVQRMIASVGSIESWHQATKNHLGQIVTQIHESLYELFADPALDVRKATESYGALLQGLGISKASKWVYATTNYDIVGETALNELGFLPDWGEPPQARSSEQLLVVDDLIRGLPRYVPVLHLHGRVGWYRRLDGYGNPVYATTATRHQPGFGVPIVMLPDPNKAYGSDPIINSLWLQFGEVLRRAKCVFVLGHSLHDDALVDALRENVDPLDRIAVSVFSSDADPDVPDDSAAEILQTIQGRLGNAAVIPMRFGSSLEAGARGIQTYLTRGFGD
jgi:hypothetical protein